MPVGDRRRAQRPGDRSRQRRLPAARSQPREQAQQGESVQAGASDSEQEAGAEQQDATRGERFPKRRTAENAWSEARATLSLAAGEEKPVTIRCEFPPQKLIVDPDVTVLMLERQKAEAKLKPAADPRTLAGAVGADATPGSR